MKILSLSLRNFQGIKEKELAFDGGNASIYGDNGTGKTTVYNAFVWLLTGGASTGAKNYTPQTVGESSLEHSAETSLLLDDGSKVTLKKVYKEVYTKKQGSSESEMTGHKTEHFVNGVPTTQAVYNEAVNGMVGTPEQLKILTMPFYFPEAMKWEERRKILLDACGDVTDEDVIASDKRLKDLPSILDGHTVEDCKKILAARRKELNAKETIIPAKIDEATRAIKDGLGTLDEAERAADSIKSDIADHREKLAALESGDGRAAERQRLIAEKKVEITTARTEFEMAEFKAIDERQKERNAIEDQLSKARCRARELESSINSLETKIKQTEEQRAVCLEAYHKAKALAWDENAEKCPTCGRELPEERIEELKAAFNIEKSDKIEKARAEGQKVSMEIIEAKKAEKKRLEDELDGVWATIESESASLRNALDGMPKRTPFDETDTYKKLAAELEAIQGSGNDTAVNNEAIALKMEIETAEKLLAEANEKIALIKTSEEQRERVRELKAEQKKDSEENEKVGRGIDLCDLFTATKVNMLNDSINRRFEKVRFRLAIEQVNGGIRDDCEVLVPSPDGKMVPFGFANNAARINAGLEIIHALSEVWGKNVPIFVDNAEAVTHLGHYDNMQVIRLVVSEQDKELRIEKEES